MARSIWCQNLFMKYPEEREGFMTHLKTKLVSLVTGSGISGGMAPCRGGCDFPSSCQSFHVIVNPLPNLEGQCRPCNQRPHAAQEDLPALNLTCVLPSSSHEIEVP